MAVPPIEASQQGRLCDESWAAKQRVWCSVRWTRAPILLLRFWGSFGRCVLLLVLLATTSSLYVTMFLKAAQKVRAPASSTRDTKPPSSQVNIMDLPPQNSSRPCRNLIKAVHFRSEFAVAQVATDMSAAYITAVLSTASRLRAVRSIADHVLVIDTLAETDLKEDIEVSCWAQDVVGRAGVVVHEHPFDEIKTAVGFLGGKRHVSTFMKLSVFALGSYRRVLSLDLDTFIARNFDELFLLSGPSSFGVPAMANWNRFTDYNTGVMLFNPSKELYRTVLTTMENGSAYRGRTEGDVKRVVSEEYARLQLNGFESNVTASDPWTSLAGPNLTDQDFLVSLFTHLGTLHSLPVTYNFRSASLGEKQSDEQYLAVFRRDTIKIVHFTVEKPWKVLQGVTGLAALFDKDTGRPKGLSGYFLRSYVKAVDDEIKRSQNDVQWLMQSSGGLDNRKLKKLQGELLTLLRGWKLLHNISFCIDEELVLSNEAQSSKALATAPPEREASSTLKGATDTTNDMLGTPKMNACALAAAANASSAPQHAFEIGFQCICQELLNSPLVQSMCKTDAITRQLATLEKGEPVWVLQIGAHMGFEVNDPLGTIMIKLLELLKYVPWANASAPKWKWLCVEPVPTFINELKTNLDLHTTDIGKFVVEQAGVLAESANEQNSTMTFFSVSPDIDSHTGLDKRSGKKLPYWATQIGSFNRQHLIKHSKAFSANGLDIEDYIEESAVPTFTVGKLMQRHHVSASSLTALLIDTEGFDCSIVASLSNELLGGCPVVVFEFKHCDPTAAIRNMEALGYVCENLDKVQGNTFCRYLL